MERDQKNVDECVRWWESEINAIKIVDLKKVSHLPTSNNKGIYFLK